MPTRGLAAWQAVTMTIVSPERTMTAPSACLASLPVSIEIVRAPTVMSRRWVSGIHCTCNVGCGGPGRAGRATRGRAPRPAGVYLRMPSSANQLRVAVGVLALQVVEQAAALADELQQAAPGMVILDVGLEVFREVVDALAEERDLNFRGAGVGVVRAVGADHFSLTLVRQHIVPSTNDPERAGARDRTAVVQ